MEVYPKEDKHCLLRHNIQISDVRNIITFPTGKRNVSADLEFRKIWKLNMLKFIHSYITIFSLRDLTPSLKETTFLQKDFIRLIMSAFFEVLTLL